MSDKSVSFFPTLPTHLLTHALTYSLTYLLTATIVEIAEMVKYFTPDEVSMHNCAADCWVSIFENVYDLTTLLEENKGE